VLEESVFKISGQLSTITRNQKYFRTRENRNFSTVRSTEKRIINFSLIQCGLIICMGALQVFIVRFFFQVGPYFHAPLRRGRTNPLDREHARAMYESCRLLASLWSAHGKVIGLLCIIRRERGV